MDEETVKISWKYSRWRVVFLPLHLTIF